MHKENCHFVIIWEFQHSTESQKSKQTVFKANDWIWNIQRQETVIYYLPWTMRSNASFKTPSGVSPAFTIICDSSEQTKPKEEKENN